MSSLHDAADPSAAAGLPDLATLTRIAGEFFSALPGNHAAGGVPVTANPQPAGLSLPPGAFGPATPAAVPYGALPPGAGLAPTSAQTPANIGASEPALQRAVEIVAGEQDRLSGIVGETHCFEAAEEVLKGLLTDRVARGAHVVIANNAAPDPHHRA